MTVVRLIDADSEERFGGKAASLARALKSGLPVPDGFAISWDHDGAEELLVAFRETGERVAVRSSAVGEDSIDASFAGQHVTVLNVTSEEMLVEAVRTIRESARADSALAYRSRMGVTGEPRIAMVMMRMIDADCAGVLFTCNPMTGASERVIESAWGLGEAVVAGLVAPDRFRISTDGEILERGAGRKDLMVRFAPGGGTIEQEVAAENIARLSLSDPELMALHRLAARCESFFGDAQDLEWAFEDGRLYLLQTRPITRGAGVPPASIGRPARSDEHGAGRPVQGGRDAHPPSYVGLALAALLAPLNSTIIAVALPSIAESFAASPAVVTRWLVTAYLVVTIVAQSPAGKLGDLWGTSRVLTLGRSMFGLGAVLAAFSPSLAALGAGRVLMALGGAFTIPTVFAALRNSVPAHKRGRVFGIFGSIMGGAAAVGPVLGGFLTARFGWHSIFVVNVPVVLLSFLLERPRRSPRIAKVTSFDFTGSAILGAAVLLLVAAIETSHIGIATLAAIGLAAFVMRELRAKDPVLDVRLFTRPAFAAGSAIVGLQNLAMYSLLFLLPFFLAKNPSDTGRVLLLFTAGMVLVAPFGGRLSDAIGPRVVALAGGMLATAGAAMFVMGDELLVSLVMTGAGIGMATSPAQAAAMSAVDASEAGVASGALSTMRYLGGVIGSGLVALIAGAGLARDGRMMIFPAVLFLSALVALALPGGRASRSPGAGRLAPR